MQPQLGHLMLYSLCISLFGEEVLKLPLSQMALSCLMQCTARCWSAYLTCTAMRAGKPHTARITPSCLPAPLRRVHPDAGAYFGFTASHAS